MSSDVMTLTEDALFATGKRPLMTISSSAANAGEVHASSATLEASAHLYVVLDMTMSPPAARGPHAAR
jgi:hypothetical protein